MLHCMSLSVHVMCERAVKSGTAVMLMMLMVVVVLSCSAYINKLAHLTAVCFMVFCSLHARPCIHASATLK